MPLTRNSPPNLEGQRKTATETGLNRTVKIQRKPAWNLTFTKSCERFYPFLQTHPALLGLPLFLNRKFLFKCPR
jgi:hypothetical protein